MRRRYLAVFVFLMVLPGSARACLWDRDTLTMERTRFPTTLELITGKFVRHSKEFYEWRIKDRTARLEKDPEQLSLYDDLAVAYIKTGQNQQAIETILKKDAKKPGLYETYANLGTFYMLDGQWQKGLEYIDKALAINPDAHFGREIYQKHLAEWVLSSPDGKIVLPFSSHVKKTYAAVLWDKMGADKFDSAKAVKGVLGMMRFADHESPILLEALGSLLTTGPSTPDDAKLLAARAFLKASHGATEESVKQAYRNMANSALSMQLPKGGAQRSATVEDIEPDFRVEMDDATQWFAGVRQNELKWIQENQDPEAEFVRTYVEVPAVVRTDSSIANLFSPQMFRIGAILFVLVASCITILVLAIRRERRAATPTS